MDSALAWVGQIAEWVGRFVPRWVILDTTEGAVKFEGFFLPRWLRKKCGGFDGYMRPTTCGPGIHWYWPAFSSMQSYPTVWQTDNLPSQTMETEDGQAFTVGGMVTYTITDLGLLLTQTHSGAKMIQAKTLASVHEVCCKMSWEQLRSEQRKGTLDTKLRHACQKPLLMFGVKIEDCQLTDLAKARVFRLIQSTQQDDGI